MITKNGIDNFISYYRMKPMIITEENKNIYISAKFAKALANAIIAQAIILAIDLMFNLEGPFIIYLLTFIMTFFLEALSFREDCMKLTIKSYVNEIMKNMRMVANGDGSISLFNGGYQVTRTKEIKRYYSYGLKETRYSVTHPDIIVVEPESFPTIHLEIFGHFKGLPDYDFFEEASCVTASCHFSGQTLFSSTIHFTWVPNNGH